MKVGFLRGFALYLWVRLELRCLYGLAALKPTGCISIQESTLVGRISARRIPFIMQMIRRTNRTSLGG